ncbi:MAG: adenosylmethionine--8-amino-7-oxononanoate transaminase [Verrucomicrobiae bacterium]|nr:adenosylmethionine--8-amino-7-oxononanoate transaminase [Verrucomicrobiae bacterium]
MGRFAELDKKYIWHPFTQMKEWLESEPIVIAKGKGCYLFDDKGKKYIDANASIWTNLHGHNNGTINRAISRQLKKIAHSSALGLANEPASILAEILLENANSHELEEKIIQSGDKQPQLEKVFYSDNGSTAMEVALKLAFEFARRTGLGKNPRFISISSAYHGDTIGAVSLGHIDLFHKTWAPLLFQTDFAMSPYCYRCRYNKSKPEREDARKYRKCNNECVTEIEKKFEQAKKQGKPYTGFVFEPLMQGAAGMIAHPSGWLNSVGKIARQHGALLIADEVMTGFGRTGVVKSNVDEKMFYPGLFACHKEGIQPDLMALAKGLTGGYLPMAATLTTKAIFNAFLGDYSEFKTFFHGHSYTGNQLCSAASIASMRLLLNKKSISERLRLEKTLQKGLNTLWELENIGDIRQIGLVAGVELVRNWRTREQFDLRERAGIRVCQAMAKRGVLTRPVGNVVVIMPPYCATEKEIGKIILSLRESIEEFFK